MFKSLDVVKLDTGTTYMVSSQKGNDVCVKGWKNGKPFGAIRYIDATRCQLIGKAIRPQTNADNWKFVPAP